MVMGLLCLLIFKIWGINQLIGENTGGTLLAIILYGMVWMEKHEQKEKPDIALTHAEFSSQAGLELIFCMCCFLVVVFFVLLSSPSSSCVRSVLCLCVPLLHR